MRKAFEEYDQDFPFEETLKLKLRPKLPLWEKLLIWFFLIACALVVGIICGVDIYALINVRLFSH